MTGGSDTSLNRKLLSHDWIMLLLNRQGRHGIEPFSSSTITTTTTATRRQRNSNKSSSGRPFIPVQRNQVMEDPIQPNRRFDSSSRMKKKNIVTCSTTSSCDTGRQQHRRRSKFCHSRGSSYYSSSQENYSKQCDGQRRHQEQEQKQSPLSKHKSLPVLPPPPPPLSTHATTSCEQRTVPASNLISFVPVEELTSNPLRDKELPYDIDFVSIQRNTTEDNDAISEVSLHDFAPMEEEGDCGCAEDSVFVGGGSWETSTSTKHDDDNGDDSFWSPKHALCVHEQYTLDNNNTTTTTLSHGLEDDGGGSSRGLLYNSMLYLQTNEEWGMTSTPLENDGDGHWPSDEDKSPIKKKL